MADLLEIRGANPFRIRAYRRAAYTIANWPESLEVLISSGRPFPKIPGMGEDLQNKAIEILQTGHLKTLDTEQRGVPIGLVDLLKLPGLGPKKVQLLREKLKIRDLASLKKAAEEGRVQKLRGFSEAAEKKILDEIERYHRFEKRCLHSISEQTAEPILEELRRIPSVDQCTIAGSYRRQRETVGDIDILATCDTPNEVMDRLTSLPQVQQVLARGPTRCTVKLRGGRDNPGLQVDLRVVPSKSYGAALHYFTGSKDHNIAIRTLGVKKGLKINEYGIFRSTKSIGGKTEEEVFASVDLPFIPPELRENRGEIEAARKGTLPALITLDDIRGDLHAHTKTTDGRETLEQMAEAAQALGYEYLAITDHSRHLTVAKGLTPGRALEQFRQIDKVNAKLKTLTLLKSIECDILEDGRLDLPDEVLKEMDLRVCSVHFKFNLSREEQTERILRAMDNPYFNILAHPTGRLLQRRDPYEIDLERIMHHAAQTGCYLELNSQPDRLDLQDIHCQMAKNSGVHIAISTDAHSSAELNLMRLGIAQARRGWIEAKDVLNTRSLPELRKLLKRK